MGHWAGDLKAHSCVATSDLLSLEMLENPEKEQWELYSQEDRGSPKKETTVPHVGLVVSLERAWVHQDGAIVQVVKGSGDHP